MNYYLKLFLVNIVSVIILHAVILKFFYSLGPGTKGIDSTLTIIITPLALCYINYVLSKGRPIANFAVNAVMIVAAILISNYLSNQNWQNATANAYANDSEMQGVYALFIVVQFFFTIAGIAAIFIAKKLEAAKSGT